MFDLHALRIRGSHKRFCTRYIHSTSHLILRWVDWEQPTLIPDSSFGAINLLVFNVFCYTPVFPVRRNVQSCEHPWRVQCSRIFLFFLHYFKTILFYTSQPDPFNPWWGRGIFRLQLSRKIYVLPSGGRYCPLAVSSAATTCPLAVQWWMALAVRKFLWHTSYKGRPRYLCGSIETSRPQQRQGSWEPPRVLKPLTTTYADPSSYVATSFDWLVFHCFISSIL